MDFFFEPGSPHDDVLAANGAPQVEAPREDVENQEERRPREEVPVAEQPVEYEGQGEGRDEEAEPVPDRRQDFAPVGEPQLKQPFREQLKLDLERLAKQFHKNLYHLKNKDITGVVALCLIATEELFPNSNKSVSVDCIDQVRWGINSSSLLEVQRSCGPLTGPPLPVHAPEPRFSQDLLSRAWSIEGIYGVAASAFGVACLVRWFYIGGVFTPSPSRLIIAVAFVAAAVYGYRIYMQRQWLNYICEQTIAESQFFLQNADEFESAAGAAMSYIMEVELVSRGYRLSLPTPTVNKMEQKLEEEHGPRNVIKNKRIRQSLITYFRDVIPVFFEADSVLEGHANKTILDYLREAKRHPTDPNLPLPVQVKNCMSLDLEEAQKIHQIRQFYDLALRMRRDLLIVIMAIPHEADLLTLTTLLEGLRKCNTVTQAACYQIKRMLLADESKLTNKPSTSSPLQANTETVHIMTSPKTPQSPQHRHWRHQLQKFKSLTAGVRDLQATMAIMVEHANITLSGSNEDISKLGPAFLAEYETLGNKLRDLMDTWEVNRASLQAGQDREREGAGRRVSQVLNMPLSPRALGFDGRGGPAEALERLSGTPSLTDASSAPTSPGLEDIPNEPETYEAIASQMRPRSMLSREERINKMREERAAKVEAQRKALANGWVIGELKDVLEKRQADRANKTRSMPLPARRPSSIQVIPLPVNI